MVKSENYQGTSTFTASPGWYTRFLKKNGISLKQKTKIAKEQSSEFEEKMIDLQCFVINKQKIGDFPLSNISNMTKTPMCFDILSNKILNQKGDKTVFIKTTGHEKSFYSGVE